MDSDQLVQLKAKLYDLQEENRNLSGLIANIAQAFQVTTIEALVEKVQEAANLLNQEEEEAPEE